MKVLSLDDLVKQNLQKNYKANISVTLLTKGKIDKYAYFCNSGFKSLSNHSPYFMKYSKAVDKLDDVCLYYEIKSPDGFSLLEYDGLKFKCIEFDDGDDNNSLKKFKYLDDLNNDLRKWNGNKYKFRTEVMHKINGLDKIFFKFCQKNQKQETKDCEEEIEK